jgi:PAS domain S-box-containing protein
MTHQDQSEQRLVDELRRRIAELEKASQEKGADAATILKVAPLGIHECDTDGRITFVNPCQERITGYTADELVGTYIWDRIEPGPQKDSLPDYLKHLLSEQPPPTPFVVRNTRKNGELYDIRIDWNYKRDPQDQVTGFVCIISDVTEQKRVEAALQENEERCRQVFEEGPLGVVLLGLDAHIQHCNHRFCEMLGYSEEEIIALDLVGITHADDWERGQQLVSRLLHGEIPNYIIEKRYIRSGGTVFWGQLTASMMHDAENKRTIVIGMVEDITERKRAEAGLCKAHDELERRVAETRLNEARLEAVLQLSHLTEASLKQITDFALEQAVALTKSKIGYLAFMNEDETVLTMHSWSKDAMAECAVSDKPLVYPLETTGLWGEAARQRTPIITNDYVAPNPSKKGLPEGHVKLRRHMNVPILDGEHIVIVAGVGNKDEDYDESDVRQLTLLMEGMWTLIQRRRVQAELQRHRDYLEQLIEERTESLRQSHDELRAIYDGMVDGLLVTDIETQRCMRVNVAICRMLGYTETELLSMSVKDIHPAEALPFILEHIRSIEEANHTPLGYIPFLRKDGSVFYAEVIGTFLIYDGRPCAMGIFRDITERKHAEEMIRESHDELQTIYDQAVDGIIIVDAEKVNPIRANSAYCRMVGYSDEEVYSVSPERLHPPEVLPAVLEHLDAVKEGSVARIDNLPFLRKDGSIIYADVVSSPIFYNKRPCWISFFHDVTERKQAQDAVERERQSLWRMLQASDHERQTISYEIHDGLAQYLAAAGMQLQVFDGLRESKPDEAKKAYDAAAQLVRQSHSESRRLISEVRHPVIDESGLETAISHLVHEQRRRGGPTIKFDSEVQFKRLPSILENAIYRIAQEALTNACKHSKSKKVTVTMTQEGQDVRLEVRDWGIGFDQDAIGKGHFGVEGIRQRVRLLDGRLTIDSKPGSGTLVQVVVPILEKQSEG